MQQHYFLDHWDKLFKIVSSDNIKQTYTLEKVEKRIKSLDFELHSPKIDHNQPVNIPLEIVDNILYFVVLAYLKNRDYHLALPLMTSFSRNFGRRIYLTLFDAMPPANYFQIPFRFATTLHFINRIHETVLNLQYTPFIHFYKIVFKVTNKSKVEPWHVFSNYPDPLRNMILSSIEAMDPPTTTALSNEEWHLFESGECFGDGVWLDGEIAENGLFVAERMLWPVIVIDLQSLDHQNMCSTKAFKKAVGWKGFNTLFRLLFGPDATVFYVVKPTGGIYPKLIAESELFLPVIDEGDV